MAGKLVCWRCGEALENVLKPFPRLFKCRHCEADLHVCLMCRHYNPRYSTRCDHEMAEPARESDLANFCHYLKLKTNAYVEKLYDQNKAAEARLKALFGDDGVAEGQLDKQADPLASLKELFGEIESDNKD